MHRSAQKRLAANAVATSVFSLNPAGMKRCAKELKRQSLMTLSPLGAQHQPGPLSAGLTGSFKRKTVQRPIAPVMEVRSG